MSNARHGAMHPYHLVRPSPWPIFGSVSALVMALGALNYMHEKQPWLLAAGLGMVLFTMSGWWRQVIREGAVDRAHTPEVRRGLRLGMALFIASEVMFFVGFFWAFFHNGLLVSPGVKQWPPPGIQPLHPWGIPFLNTGILMGSGVTCLLAHHAVRRSDPGATVRQLLATIALGIIFLTLQGVEYGHALFKFTDGIYPSVFYMATGFHGFHVFVGVCFLAVNLVRARASQLSPTHHIGFEAAVWYWHFVDGVWVFLFVWVYWWGG
ncbi:MAG: cytochrome c oxidase subunit 3 [Alphaproteobacteria bacterium]|nr:cytochrome c oxidase subunit 3 [Alphaproteobacteria bacterium]